MTELNYFQIEGVYGSSQDWFSNFMMNKGGCAAVTACDSCIYLAREFGLTKLYPFDAEHLTKKDYVQFGMMMKPYLKPRMGGISKLSMYEEGFGGYMQDKDIDISAVGFSGKNSYFAAAEFVKKQIDKKIPIPYLLLKHKNPDFRNFLWHWFLVTGYEECGDDMQIKVATYGHATILSLCDLWNTGYEGMGGMIEFIM